MKNRYAVALSTLATVALASGTPAFAKGIHGEARMGSMNRQIAVLNIYPTSATQVNLSVKNSMDLEGKSITLKATHTMGMMMGTTTLTAKYDGMKKGFVLPGHEKLIPGVTYKIDAMWAKRSMKHDTFVIPDLLRVQQVSKNRLLVVFDKKVDTMSAMTPGNFWIQSNQAMASGIAELGKADKVTPTNGLSKMDVTITERGMSGRQFYFTFHSDITPGVTYTLIPCGVSLDGEASYAGPNFNSMSHNSFTGASM